MHTYQITLSRGGGTHLCYATSLAVAVKRLLNGYAYGSAKGPFPVLLDRGKVLEITVLRIA